VSNYEGSADADAIIAAIEATGVTLSSGEKTAITNRVVAAKGDGVWTKWIAYYGFVGGTANSHAINWKNPAQYLISWSGSLTHSANGVKGNGSNGYGNTGLNPSTVLSNTACGLGVYYTDNKPNETTYDIGSGDSTTSLGLYLANPNAGFEVGGTNSVDVSNDHSKQYLSGNLIGTTQKLYKNGSSVGSVTNTGSLPNLNLYISARNNNGSPLFFSNARIGGISINTGLTDAEEAANYVSELAFQTALGRN
jgi:hypothetical protein